MNEILVFGHKNPDSDTICSALAYAQLKRMTGANAVAAKLGELNNETKFILQYFHVQEPETLQTVKTQVLDLDIDEPVHVSPATSIHGAWELMQKHGKKSLAVVDDEQRLLGVATLSDITKNYMDVGDSDLLSASRTSYASIIETLCALVVAGSPEGRVVAGRVVIAAQHHSRLRDYVREGDIVIANIFQNIHEAINCGAGLIVCTCGVLPKEEDIEFARERGCCAVTTEQDTYIASMLIRQSIPVEYVMTRKNLVTVGLDEFKDDVKERMLKTRYRTYPVVDAEKRVVGMISRYHLLSKKRKQVILLDHNERSQTANGLEDAEILEIIDHHRLGDIQTNNPILMKNEPVGSTATIVASLFEAQQAPISPKTAGLLLSAILSDTLNFQSPTCTERDRETAKRLAPIADVVIEDLALKIINAGSTLLGKTPEEIIESDLKEYEVGKLKIGVAQVYSIDSENFSDMQADILAQMDYTCGKKGLHLLMLLVTDLNAGGSRVLLAGDRQDIFYKAYGTEPKNGPIFLPGVLSRKKQVVPLIMSLEDEL